MESTCSGRTPTSVVFPVTFLEDVGLWFWLADGGGAAVLLGAAALVLTALLGIAWLSRARGARRCTAAVDAYADREIDRERRKNGPQRVRGVSTRMGALPGGSTHGLGTPCRGPFPLSSDRTAVGPG
jgi:hypothetical protein